jgi:hypothetical protein
MLALAGINALGLALFLGLYVAGALRWLSHGAFLVGVVVLVGAVTALWVHVEARGAATRGVLERIGRAAVALVLVVVVGPVAVLMPLFALDAQLPAEATMGHVISRTMVILLVSIALVVLCNLGGSIALAVRALCARIGPSGPSVR